MLAMMQRRRDALELRRAGDGGFTLVEMLVVMVIFSIVLGIVGVAITQMFKVTRRESAITQDLTAVRSVNNVLDDSVRFANAISQPGLGATGDTYIEWQTGDTTGVDTSAACTQWRFDPTAHVLQSRSWTQSASVLLTTPTAWLTRASGIYADGTHAMFITTGNTVMNTTPGAFNYEQLAVDFVAQAGLPARSQTNNVSFTAINSHSVNAAAAVCTEGGRP
jgi:prepilin-type N-terminal cleavage/methylation domain-containing protein